MFSLRKGYLATGIVTGLMLMFAFLATLPDGKLHIVFCNVGQGDAAFIRFSDGRDMLVDGGPNDKILQCLGKHMPFWDRKIDIVLLTHPQRDHFAGLVAVLDRYAIDYFVKSDVDGDTDGYRQLIGTIRQKRIPLKLVTRGDTISVGTTTLSVLWPSSSVLGVSTDAQINDASIVFWLNYGSFDALFPGDADTRVESGWKSLALRLRSGQALNGVEVLKVPHHGSRTGMSEEFMKKFRPALSVISVGVNSYGHPAKEILDKLALAGSQVLRTDKEKDIEVVSDGKSWMVLDK